MKYMTLDQKGGYMAEYIWIDGQNGVRSKTKVRCCPSISLSTALFAALPHAAAVAVLSKRPYWSTRRPHPTQFAPHMLQNTDLVRLLILAA